MTDGVLPETPAFDSDRLLKDTALRIRRQFHDQPTVGHSTDAIDCWHCQMFVQIMQHPLKLAAEQIDSLSYRLSHANDIISVLEGQANDDCPICGGTEPHTFTGNDRGGIDERCTAVAKAIDEHAGSWLHRFNP